MEKKNIRKNMCMYNWNHFAVHQKLTHCKSTILQCSLHKIMNSNNYTKNNLSNDVKNKSKNTLHCKYINKIISHLFSNEYHNKLTVETSM